jgi:hypothetical protein
MAGNLEAEKPGGPTGFVVLVGTFRIDGSGVGGGFGVRDVHGVRSQCYCCAHMVHVLLISDDFFGLHLRGALGRAERAVHLRGSGKEAGDGHFGQ